ncbi:MAG TPA: GNAT family N-acetyltransferase [Chitinophagaceae bacterium]|nr:GNAT family N-acetyltransferase [Chitinophagaceae bacterium]
MLTPDFSIFPTFHTERLLIRRIETKDAEAIYCLRSDQQVMQWLDRPLAQSIDEALHFILKIQAALDSNEGITWGISLKDQPVLIGTIGYWRIIKDHYRAEIGYLLNPKFQGIGIMQEAISSVLNYGFRDMKLHSIEANVNPANLSSIKLLEKNGFVREAWFKENYYYNGKFLDSLIYTKLSQHHPWD